MQHKATHTKIQALANECLHFVHWLDLATSSNVNEVIRAVLNSFYEKILHATKTPKAQKAQKRNQAKAQKPQKRK